jgi:hypothetical protein
MLATHGQRLTPIWYYAISDLYGQNTGLKSAVFLAFSASVDVAVCVWKEKEELKQIAPKCR